MIPRVYLDNVIASGLVRKDLRPAEEMEAAEHLKLLHVAGEIEIVSSRLSHHEQASTVDTAVRAALQERSGEVAVVQGDHRLLGFSHQDLGRDGFISSPIITDISRHADAGGRGGRQIPADGFGIEPVLGGDALLRRALASEPKDFPDFNHGDLAIHPRLLVPGNGPGLETSIARSGERGDRF